MISHKMGYCAYCGSDDINYEPIEIYGEQACFPYNCCNCEDRGFEWYSLTYIETRTDAVEQWEIVHDGDAPHTEPAPTINNHPTNSYPYFTE